MIASVLENHIQQSAAEYRNYSTTQQHPSCRVICLARTEDLINEQKKCRASCISLHSVCVHASEVGEGSFVLKLGSESKW